MSKAEADSALPPPQAGPTSQIVDVELVVLDPTEVGVGLLSTDLRGGRRGAGVLEVCNDSAAALTLAVSGQTRDGEVRFREHQIGLGPGEARSVRFHVRAERPLLGHRSHIPFVVSVDGAGPRRQLVGTFEQGAVIATNLFRVLLVLSIIAGWLAILIVAVGIVRERSQRDEGFMPRPEPVTVPAVTDPRR